MTREQFYEAYGEKLKSEGAECYERNTVIEIVRIETIYNRLLNLSRNLTETYKIKAGEIWSSANNRAFERIDGLEPSELLEKSKLAKELVKQGYEVEAKISVESKVLPNGEVHHWVVYAIFTCNVEALQCYWGNKYKQKVFVFTPDGMFTIKHAPFILKDETNPVGSLGISRTTDAIVLSEI